MAVQAVRKIMFMPSTELPLYPKISSIYNKILQISLAVVLIALVLQLMIFNEQSEKQSLAQHFSQLGHTLAEQAGRAFKALPEKNHTQLQILVEQLADGEKVFDAVIFDQTGQVVAQSTNTLTIKDLYGVNQYQLDRSDKYIPFVAELNSEQFSGYLRLTLIKATFSDGLVLAQQQQAYWQRIMLLMALAIGFLLTRGFNRFSRQGYRLSPNTRAYK